MHICIYVNLYLSASVQSHIHDDVFSVDVLLMIAGLVLAFVRFPPLEASSKESLPPNTGLLLSSSI